MHTSANHAPSRPCREYMELSRRRFMALSGTSAAIIASAPAWLPRVAFARDGAAQPRDVIIQIFLRGGADGMSILAPYSESEYYALRPTIALPRPDDSGAAANARLLALNQGGPVMFGLNSAMASLMPAYQAGNLLAVHATGLTDSTRSHFDAQKYMEQGYNPDPLSNTGWLGRHIAGSQPMNPEATVRAIALADALQITLAGAPLAIPTPNPDNVYFAGSGETQAARLDLLTSMYGASNDLLKPAATAILATLNKLEEINFGDYAPGGDAQYPENSYPSYALRSAAALMKAQIGVEAITMDFGGWDTHSNQGSGPGGDMFNNLKQLADALAAFHADMAAAGGVNYTLVIMSEFGRRAFENGSFGTDHGHGNIMFAMGQNINGGKVIANWPGLAEDDLDDGDVAITIDYRDILAEIVQNRLGNSDLASVFPNFTPTFRGVTA